MLPAGVQSELLESLRQSSPPHTRSASFSVAAFTQLQGGGPDPEAAFEPALVDPLAVRIQKFEALDLPERDKAMKEWARKELIPILAHYTSKVDPKYEGVRAVGKIMSEEQFLSRDVKSLTTLNPDYWRAIMEMSPGDQIIPWSKAAMHLARGEYALADKQVFISGFFAEPKSLIALLQDEVNDLIKGMQQALGKEIQKGIDLHDQGKYKAAVKHYEGLLATFPHSPWLQYEHYFSSTAGSNDDEADLAAWNKAKPLIYGADPLYPMDVRASNGREGYLLFRRQEIPSLFKSKEDFQKDFLNYADIALDLGAYGFAAQMYWLANLHFKPEDVGNRDLLAHFFYCLDKLGDKETVQFMKDADDYPDKFSKIEKERQKLMEESVIYKSFKKGK